MSQPLSITLFESLFHEHYKSLCRFATGMLKSAEDAEEIVQDVFVKCWEKRESIEAGSWKSYLYRAVYNAALNAIKHQKVRMAYAQEAAATEQEHQGSFEENFHANELGQKVEQAIATLPEQCRKVFVMSRFEEKKYKDIAAEMNISIKTVENQMGKALRVLREHLMVEIMMGGIALEEIFKVYFTSA